MELQPIQTDEKADATASTLTTSTKQTETNLEADPSAGNGVVEVYHDLSQVGGSRPPPARCSTLVKAVNDFLCPPDLPPSVQLLRWENLVIPVSYGVVGTLQGLFRTLLNVYPLALGATEAQQTTFATVATLPAAFKIIYGFTSDNLPLGGYRRKPYLFLGWCGATVMMVLLILTTDLTLGYTSTGEAVPPPDAPSLTWLSVAFFLFGICLWFADATCDAIVAEKARCEPIDRRGSLQSTCYACRFFGLMVSAPLSNYLYAHVGPQVVIYLLALIPAVTFPLCYLLKEERNVPIRSVSAQCNEIWDTVCSRSVWEPMGFIYLFNLLQVQNAAWRQFLRTVWSFSDSELNDLLVASYVLLYVGTMVYKYCFLQISWRHVYLGCILLNGVFSGLQLLFIRGKTLGLSPFWFALGDDAMAEFIAGVQFLPCTIMMVALTPAGSEGAAYAMFTTVWNSAMMISPAMGSVLLGIWDTSPSALAAGQLDGLFKLSILTTVLQVSPVFFLRWMPHNRETLYALSDKAGSGNPVGGAIFLTVLFGSMMWTMVVAVLNITDPGWAGA